MGKGIKGRFEQDRAPVYHLPHKQVKYSTQGSEASFDDNSIDLSYKSHLIQDEKNQHFQIKQEPDFSYEECPNEKLQNGLVSLEIKRKKGSGTQGKSIEEELCLICGDRASGYHYNALSCEGCKGFFRRSITRGASYTCKYGGNCEMDMWMRRKCQACRLRRCKEVGMKEECLLSDEQCKARDARRKARQKVVNKDKESAPSPDTSNTEKKSFEPPANLLETLPPKNRELLEKLVFFQDKYEIPSEEDMAKVTSVKISQESKPKELNDVIFSQMAEMTVLVTYLIVEFAKNLPGFNQVDREDQILLLKGSACEIMMMRTSRRYDFETETIVFGNGMPYTKDNLRFAGLKDYVDSMFAFCHGMGKLGVDNAEYALLTAICLFSERPGLKEPHVVERIQAMYVDTLSKYNSQRRPKNSNFFAKLLMKLTDLRTLSSEHADVLFSIKLERGDLPPLLSEYFEVVE